VVARGDHEQDAASGIIAHGNSFDQKEDHEILVITLADTVVDPRTVVIELGNASVAVSAVFDTGKFGDSTSDTHSFHQTILETLFIAVRFSAID